MKLEDLDKKSKGTYVASTLSDETIENLKKYIKDNKIPGGVNDFHITLIYSRKPLPKFVPEKQYDPPITGKFDKLHVFDEDNEDKCLVIKLNCPRLYQRHHMIRAKHGATHDFETYIPHITLSYDIKDMDIAKLPNFFDDIVIVGEYAEELDPD